MCVSVQRDGMLTSRLSGAQDPHSSIACRLPSSSLQRWPVQTEAQVRLDEVAARMALMRDQASSLEARVGSAGGLQGNALAALGLAPPQGMQPGDG